MQGETSQDELPRFTILENPEIEGLTPQLLKDLHDITVCWGQVNAVDKTVNFRSGDLGSGFELATMEPIEPDKKGLSVFGTQDLEPLFVGSFKGLAIVNTTDGTIFWSRNVTVPEVKSAVQKIDKKAKEVGLIDQTGERIPFPDELRLNKSPYRKVEETFKQPGTAIPVLPGMDPKDILSMFDHPELLELHETPTGSYVIVAKKDKLYTKERERIAFEVFNEEGLSLSDLDGLPLEEILRIRKKIDDRIANS